MKKYETLTLKNIQLRSQESDGKKTLIGIIPYNSKSEDMGGFREVIAPTAFNKTLADGAEVRALFNHDTSRILGSTRSGTLRLTNSDEGLMAEVDLPNTTYANDLFEIVSRSDVSTMSFAFTPIKVENSRSIRTLKEVALAEVSFGVSFPAYPETNSVAFLRSYLNQRSIELDAIDEIIGKDGKDISEDEKIKLKDFVESVRVLYEPKEPAVMEPVKETVPVEPAVPAVDEQLLLELEIEQSI